MMDHRDDDIVRTEDGERTCQSTLTHSSSTETLVKDDEKHRRNILPLKQRLGFSVGHVLNDLCSAIWFTYLLIYMQYVRNMSASLAGVTLLIGQIADGIATPFVGLESDRPTPWAFCFDYGKRKTWHMVGTICVIFSFPMIFISCLGCTSATSSIAQLVYYSSFIIIFQFGWAATQISHLSLIPELTPCTHERLQMNAWRYAWTVTSNVAVYSITWVLFGLDTSDDPNGSVEGRKVSPSDATHFRNLVLIIVALGAFFSAIFHLVVKEKNYVTPEEAAFRRRTISISSIDYSLPCNHLQWHHWFTVSQFYKVGVLYMGTRLTINLSQAYIPFYLQESLNLHRESIAYIPLFMYLSGFLSSFLMKYINAKIGKKWTYLLGGLIAIVGFLWLYFAQSTDAFFIKYGVYAVSATMGVSGSTMLITSLGITNDLIGHNTSSGAFVFGAMSFLDKVSNGAAVMIIQSIRDNFVCPSSYGSFYRNILVFVCGGSTGLALFGLALLSRDKIGVKRKGSVQPPPITQPPTGETIVTEGTDSGISVRSRVDDRGKTTTDPAAQNEAATGGNGESRVHSDDGHHHHIHGLRNDAYDDRDDVPNVSAVDPQDLKFVRDQTTGQVSSK